MLATVHLLCQFVCLPFGPTPQDPFPLVLLALLSQIVQIYFTR